MRKNALPETRSLILGIGKEWRRKGEGKRKRKRRGSEGGERLRECPNTNSWLRICDRSTCLLAISAD